MRIVELIFDDEKKQMEFRGTLADLLKAMKVSREEVVVKVNGKLVPETREIRDDDKIQIIKVVFGG